MRVRLPGRAIDIAVAAVVALSLDGLTVAAEPSPSKIDLSKATKEYDLNHLIALQVNEATKLLEEGVADDPKEIDLAMANGGGSPFGPFLLAQGIGYPVLLAKLDELYKKFPLEIFKPTETMKKGEIKV